MSILFGASEVKKLTDADEYLKIAQPSDLPNFVPNFVVLYAADWCPHCQVLKPIFTEVARKNSDIPAYIVDNTVVDALRETAPALFEGVNGWPAVGTVSNGVFKLMKEGQAMPSGSKNPLVKAIEDKALEEKTQKEIQRIFDSLKDN
jgi:thiol-disulfide isomerase/thioredoxin